MSETTTSVNNKWSIYTNFSIIIMGMLALIYILYIGQNIIIPIVLASILAILLDPVVEFLCRKKINRIIAIFITVFASFILLIALVYFIVSQASMVSDSFPQFKEKFTLMSNDVIDWVSSNLNISKTKIQTWIRETTNEKMNNSSALIGSALMSITGVLALLLLLPIYIFMILFYKPLLLEFISQLFKSEKKEVVTEILVETKSLIQNYLIGLLTEASMVAALISIGLLIIGIPYAILIGCLGALLNFIPYVGSMVGICIPLLMAFATKTPTHALLVLIMYLAVQFIDNNFLVPKIVASKVKVNAMVAIMVILISGSIWGVAGMFLAIPLTAIFKVICDKIPTLQPLGFLIGDNQPKIGHVIFKKKNTHKVDNKKKA